MDFNKFIENCNRLRKEHPEVGRYNVVCSSDEEGNSFGEVTYNPTVCFVEDGDWQSVNFAWQPVVKEGPKEQLYCSQCEQPVEEINQKTAECYECYLDNLQKANSVCVN